MASSAPVQPPVNGSVSNGPLKRRIKKNTTNPFAVARQPGGAKPLPTANGRPTPPSRPAPPSATAAAAAALKPGQYSGFSDPQLGKHVDYRLVVTKKDLMDGLRYHILHMVADDKKKVDIRDQSQFARPAHLHRRDPMADAAGMLKDEQIEVRDGLTVAEREEQSKKNEIRKQEREANLAQIAPTQSRKGPRQTLKTKAVYHKEYTEEDKRRIQTNYEEKLPWHLEDFDNKHCFVGENQMPSAHRHVALAYDRADPTTAKFRLVPLEKVYEFRPKRKVVQAHSLEQAEALMKRRANLPEWLERVEQKSMQKKKEQMTQQQTASIYTGASTSNKFAGRTGEGADMDFDDDELFADDEEGDILKVQDEDEEHAKKRIKEDQLKANYFENKEEREFDEEEQEELREEQARRENFKRIRRALEKHEHDYNHASDSEYSSSDSEEERQRIEAERQRNLDANNQTQSQSEAQAGQLLPDGSVKASMPSGTTTPSTRKPDRILTDTEGNAKSLSSRKRPGSPILSEAGSGTDTSIRKKKHKSKHQSGPSTQPVSRSGSPGPTSGSTSTSKLKIRRDGTPSGLPSRPASTAPPGSQSPSETPMPSLQDIRDTITRSLPDGLTIPELLNVQPHPRDRSKEFIQLVKTVAKSVTLESGKKVLVLKNS